VRTSEFYCLLGPNGAGKTTTLRMLAGLLRLNAGTISVLGIDALADPVAAKSVMAWISERADDLRQVNNRSNIWNSSPVFGALTQPKPTSRR